MLVDSHAVLLRKMEVITPCRPFSLCVKWWIAIHYVVYVFRQMTFSLVIETIAIQLGKLGSTR